VTYTDTALVISVLQNMYPNAKTSWIRRATEDLIDWSNRVKNPTAAQNAEQDARTKKMCTTGRWYS
jgi:hypothetical protein